MKLIENKNGQIVKLIDIDKYIETMPIYDINDVGHLRLKIVSTVIDNLLNFPTIFYLQLDFLGMNTNRYEKKSFTISPLVVAGDLYSNIIEQYKKDLEQDARRTNFYLYINSHKKTHSKTVPSALESVCTLDAIRLEIKKSFDYLNNKLELLKQITNKTNYPIFNIKVVERDGKINNELNSNLNELLGEEGLKLLNYYLLNDNLVNNKKYVGNIINKNKI